MIKTVVLKSLGLKAFIKNDQGNFDLSDAHKNALVGVFGQAFTDKFVEALNKEKAEDNGGEQAEANQVDAAGLMEALQAHHTGVIANNVQDLQARLNAANLSLAAANADKETLQRTVAALSDESEPDAQAEIPKFKGGSGKSFKVARNAYYAAANSFLASGNPNDFSAASIEVGELKSEFGNYLSQNGNNLEIIKKIFKEFSSAKFFKTVRAVTEWRAVKALISSVTQQFTAKWTPGGKAKFVPLTIVNRRHKINFPIIPADVSTSYMFHLYDEGKTPDQMPITLYIWNELIYPQLLQDIEMRQIWKGKFVDHSSTQEENSAATAPEDAMDGIETILVEAKVSKDKGVHFYKPNVKFDFKAAAAAGQWQSILDFVNGFVDWISPFYKTQKMPLFISDDNKRLYKRAYKKVWGVNSGQDGDFGTDRVDYSNQMLTSPEGMFNSPILFSTPMENMILLRHINELPNVIKDVQVHGYEVRIFGEYWFAVGLAIGNAVWAYVPDGYNPKAEITGALGDYKDFQDDFLDVAESSEESSI